MHDVVVDALGRIEAAEEAAAFDAIKPKRGDGRRNADWTIDSEIIGTVKQADIPRLMTDALAETALVYGGCRKLAARLGVSSPRSLRGYADNEYKMNYTVGQRFVYYLEQQAQKSGAAPAATGTAPEQKTAEEAPVAIVPQPAQDDKTTDLQARIAELEAQNSELKTALDTAAAKLASVQGREMSELEDEVETLRRRVAHYEADDAACGPARVEELEDRLSRSHDEHVRDLELIRDLTRRLVAHGAC